MAFASVVFGIDAFTQTELCLAALYMPVILKVGSAGRRDWVIYATLGCAALAGLSFVFRADPAALDVAATRCAVILAAIVGTGALQLLAILRSQAGATRLRGLADGHESVITTTLRGIVTDWSLGASHMYGWTSQEAIGQSLRSLLKLTSPVPPDGIAGTAATGAWRGDIGVHPKLGPRLMIEARCAPLLDDRGRPLGFVITGDDLTSRYAADLRLRRRAARCRNIFEATGVSIWECDFSAVTARIEELRREGMTDLRRYLADHPEFVRTAIDLTRAVDVNGATLRLFKAASREQILGAVGRIWPVESEPVFAQSMIAAVERRPSFESETCLLDLEGGRIDLLLSTAFPPGAGEQQNIFIAVSDITARNETQAALQASQQDLAHAARLTSLGELTASIAHEVNQPLAGILSNAQASLRWLRRDPPDIAAASRSLDGLVAETKRAGSVISGILGLARNATTAPLPLDPSALIDETLALLTHEIRRHDVELVTDLRSPTARLEGDRVQIQQVIINLVMNALQAMEGNAKGSRRLTVMSRNANDEMLVSVGDTGPGVRADLRGQLFSAFVTSKSDGLGLGLSVCSSIIRRHGGRIWAEPDDAAGATLSFSLPFKESDTQ